MEQRFLVSSLWRVNSAYRREAAIVNFPIKMQNGLIGPWPFRSRSNDPVQIDSTFRWLGTSFPFIALNDIIELKTTKLWTGTSYNAQSAHSF